MAQGRNRYSVISDGLPSQIPDVFSSKPIVIYGRYATPGQGKLTLTGTMAGQPWSQTIDILNRMASLVRY